MRSTTQALVVAVLVGCFCLPANTGGLPLIAENKEIDVTALEERVRMFLDRGGVSITSLTVLEEARLEDYRDSTLPFLSRLTNGRQVIRIDAIPMIVQRSDSTPDSILNWVAQFNFSAVFDSETGKFIQAHHSATCEDCMVPPDPPATVAEEQLRMTHERYWGFPDQTPQLDLSTVLRLKFGVATPNERLDVKVEYLLYGEDSVNAVPAWVISLKGIRPLRLGQRDDASPARIEGLVVLRYVIDAATGEALMCNNRPVITGKWRPPDTATAAKRGY